MTYTKIALTQIPAQKILAPPTNAPTLLSAMNQPALLVRLTTPNTVTRIQMMPTLTELA